MRAAYGDIADRIIANYTPFLEMVVGSNFDALKERIADRWSEVQEIAVGVPPARKIVRLLEQAGGIGDPQAAGLGEDDVQQALECAHYLRNRFTVYWLGRVLKLWS